MPNPHRHWLACFLSLVGADVPEAPRQIEPPWRHAAQQDVESVEKGLLKEKQENARKHN